MATVYWVGRQRKRAQVDTITVGSATAAQTFTVTVGGRKTVTYTAGGSETTVTVTAALLALLQAMDDGEFTELTFATPSSATSTITATGPDDGCPFTLAVGGTGTISRTATTTPLSPHDLNDAANYSGNAVPSASDVLVFEDGDVDAKYNAAALTAIALASVTRRASYTGRLGLPSENPNGYPEYRTQHVELNCPTVNLEQAAGDVAGQFRLKCVHTGSAATFTIAGGGAGAVGEEVFEVFGLPASSVVQVSGASVALAHLAGQTATAATVAAKDAVVWIGAGVTLTTASLTNCQGRVEASWTTLTMLVGGRVEVLGAAAGSAAGTLVYKGTLVWKSTGATGNSPVVGSGGTVDFSQAPAAVTVGGTVELNAGAGWLDPAGVISTSYNLKLNRCNAADVNLDLGVNKTLAVS